MVNLSVPSHNRYIAIGVILVIAVLIDQFFPELARNGNSRGTDMEPTLRVQGLTKRFGGLTAVDHVDMEVYPGEIVGLLGDNGAGKSTLIKMISGVYHPDEGEIFFEGRNTRLGSPMNALELGIETLYQDLALAENLNVYANIFLGREKTRPFLGRHPGARPQRDARRGEQGAQAP